MENDSFRLVIWFMFHRMFAYTSDGLSCLGPLREGQEDAYLEATLELRCWKEIDVQAEGSNSVVGSLHPTFGRFNVINY